MQDHVLRPRHAFDFGDEVTIGGRDAVSSSSAVVSDRLGSLSYHKPDHPTLNAAAALGPTRANQLPVALGLSVQASGADQLHATFGRSLFPNPIFIRTEKGCYVRGRSSGKTGPPAPRFHPGTQPPKEKPESTTLIENF